MSQSVTIELPDEVMQRAERLAAVSHRGVTELLTEALAIALPPMDSVPMGKGDVTQLSDGEVLKLAEQRLPEEQGERLSDLLDAQQAGTLGEEERSELGSLIQAYEASWLWQAEALAEAVRRGLRGPLAP